MDSLTVGHYQYHKIDVSERWFRKQKTIDGLLVDVRTGKRISVANNEIAKLRADNKRLRDFLTDLHGSIADDGAAQKIANVLKPTKEVDDERVRRMEP